MKPWIVMDADAEMERELKTVREQMVGATREQVATTRQLQADCPRWAGEGLPVPRLTNSWRNWRPSDGTPSDELAFWCLQSVGWNYEDALAALPRTSAPYVALPRTPAPCVADSPPDLQPAAPAKLRQSTSALLADTVHNGVLLQVRCVQICTRACMAVRVQKCTKHNECATSPPPCSLSPGTAISARKR